MNPDRILVTGSNGTIGTAVIESLLGRGSTVTGIDRRGDAWSEDVGSLTEEADIRETALDDLVPEVDLVLHFAATSRVGETVAHPERAVENFETTQQVLEYARQCGASLIYASSREVYGDSGAAPREESDVPFDACQNPYAASKFGGEGLVNAYRHSYGLPAAIIRYSNVYGRYDRSDRVVPTFIANALAGDDIEVYGSGKLLDFVHMHDAVRGTLAAVERFGAVEGEAINIGSGTGTTLTDLAEVITDAADSEATVRVTDDRTGEVSRFVADIGKAQSVLDYEQRYDIRTGIEDALEWYGARPEVLDHVRGPDA